MPKSSSIYPTLRKRQSSSQAVGVALRTPHCFLSTKNTCAAHSLFLCRFFGFSCRFVAVP